MSRPESDWLSQVCDSGESVNSGHTVYHQDIARARGLMDQHDIVMRQVSRCRVSARESAEHMAGLGRVLWEVSYKDTQDDERAMRMIGERVYEASGMNPEAAEYLATMCQVPEQAFHVLFMAKWVDCACPRIRLSGLKYAALLLATTTTPEVLDAVVAPHSAFTIELDPGVLTTRCSSGQMESLRRVCVHRLDDGRWNIQAHAPSDMCPRPVQLWRHGISTEQLVSEADIALQAYDFEDAHKIEAMGDRDKRVLLLVGRLVVSVCLAMTDPDNWRRVPNRKGARRQGRKGPPDSRSETLRDYVLGTPTPLDCRPLVEAFVEGTEQRLAVQFPVRSHWKRVAYGPRSSLRRVQRIESYWKGPTDAPFANSKTVVRATISQTGELK